MMDNLFFNSTRLLVVEHDLGNAERIAQTLRGAGYYVQNAYSASDAVAIDHKMFHLALVNTAMQDRTGYNLVDIIVKHTTFSALPILFMTDDDSLQSDNGVLLRPFSDQELLRRVEHMVNQVKSETRQQKYQSLITEDDIPTEPSRVTFDAHLQQQLAELKTLSNLGRSISSVLELNEVLNQIVEAATTLTRAEEGMLLLPDEEGKALYLRAMKGWMTAVRITSALRQKTR
jgi:DNA-binding response OmpR family regulator